MMYYFAYASNLSKKQMIARCPDSKAMFSATLPNYQLFFGGWSRAWRGGMANIKGFRGKKVLGAIYDVTEQCLRRLDKYEAGYQRFNIIVFDEDGQQIEAVTYIKMGQVEETSPSREYLAVIKQGYKDWRLLSVAQ